MLTARRGALDVRLCKKLKAKINLSATVGLWLFSVDGIVALALTTGAVKYKGNVMGHKTCLAYMFSTVLADVGV